MHYIKFYCLILNEHSLKTLQQFEMVYASGKFIEQMLMYSLLPYYMKITAPSLVNGDIYSEVPTKLNILTLSVLPI